jgi:hypothetical protein
MTNNDLIGTVIGLGILGIGVLVRVLWCAIRDCAHDTSDFPDQHEEVK